MRVRLTIPRSGPTGSYDIGDEIELPDRQAQRLIDAGKATPVRSQPVETTVAHGVERTARKKLSRKKRGKRS